MEDCIFCKIMKGEIPSYTIYEDEIVKVFLDIEPITDGHCLVVPKKHTENIETIDDETLKHMQKISREMYNLFKEKLGCTGMTRLQNNGYGQDVKHYHLHLIPRYGNDGIIIDHKNKLEPSEVFNKIINSQNP